MHMADALIAPAVAGTMYVLSTGAAGVSVKKVREESDESKIPVMGVMGAFVFATQMLNFTIPGTGSSGHLCGGMMLSALLGPYAGFLTMIGVLLVQCLLFADGGLMALGCNVWNMAFYGCFIGALLIWRPIMKKGASRAKIILASILGCVLTLQLGAFSVTLETLISGITELPFSTFVATMQPIHLAIGFVEGLITSAVLIFIYEARPELLWGVGEASEKKEAKLSLKKTIIVLAVAALICGGFVSLYASAFPDGLEWSMEQVAGTSELEAEGTVYETAESIQETTSLLPDYAFPDSEAAVGTSFSGIVGAILVATLSAVFCYVFRFFRKKTETKTA
ncbi:cobalamin biosynthesis protein CbiM [Butyrivibrio sp. X503]|uniref:energy-coupling factor ABC transporter permease n=1 Tax=unclassified Butyrivibrio TaxID=2639466 RepID=UPI000EA96962|nr:MULTISPECIES: energy-coupling factor ABC transporter permease [unclassified Butyrivibrio]RKM58281.1 cobalamin biosynthesis protein CbiM [Butyrivibrio sp. X503]RKM60103.1 cobalamin biosynthesis protein CbiM [Butyrivibrio sp. XB500-5]